MCELYLPVGTLGSSLLLVNRKCTFSGAFDVCGFRDTKLCDSCIVHYLQDLHSVRCLCDNLFNSLVQDHFLWEGGKSQLLQRNTNRYNTYMYMYMFVDNVCTWICLTMLCVHLIGGKMAHTEGQWPLYYNCAPAVGDWREWVHLHCSRYTDTRGVAQQSTVSSTWSSWDDTGMDDTVSVYSLSIIMYVCIAALSHIDSYMCMYVRVAALWDRTLIVTYTMEPL